MSARLMVAIGVVSLSLNITIISGTLLLKRQIWEQVCHFWLQFSDKLGENRTTVSKMKITNVHPYANKQ